MNVSSVTVYGVKAVEPTAALRSLRSASICANCRLSMISDVCDEL